jgi:hypothetical protein
MAWSPFETPLDRVASAYRESLSSEPTFSKENKRSVDDAVFLGTEFYEMLHKRYGLPLDEGFPVLRNLPGDKALELTRLFREWLQVTRDVVLPLADAIEQADKAIVSNSQLLHCYANRMDELLSQWDTTLTQANVAYRDTELNEDESRAFHETTAAGRGRIKLKTPPAA